MFDLDDPMGESTCVTCGSACRPAHDGALMPARDVREIVADKQVESVCPCGVGCQLTYIKANKILFVQGKDGPADSGTSASGPLRLRPVQHKHRLTRPLMRKPGIAKHKDFTVDPDNRATCSEKHLGRSARLLANGLRDSNTCGKRSLAGFGSRRAPTREPTCSEAGARDSGSKTSITVPASAASGVAR